MWESVIIDGNSALLCRENEAVGNSRDFFITRNRTTWREGQRVTHKGRPATLLQVIYPLFPDGGFHIVVLYDEGRQRQDVVYRMEELEA